jgi:hypothetical protein
MSIGADHQEIGANRFGRRGCSSRSRNLARSTSTSDRATTPSCGSWPLTVTPAHSSRDRKRSDRANRPSCSPNRP